MGAQQHSNLKRNKGFGQEPNSPIIRDIKQSEADERASLLGPSFFVVDRYVETDPIK